MRRLILAIFSLLAFSGPVLATTYYIDLNDFTPAGGLAGPCYCGGGPFYSFSGFQDGDIVKFGSVTISAVFDDHSYGRIYPPPEGEYAVIAMKMSTYLGGASLWSANTYPGQLGSTFHDLSETATFDLTFTVSAVAFSIGWDGPGAYIPALAPAVPEPSTWAMMVLGFAGVGLLAYRRRNQAASFTAA